MIGTRLKRRQEADGRKKRRRQARRGGKRDLGGKKNWVAGSGGVGRSVSRRGMLD